MGQYFIYLTESILFNIVGERMMASAEYGTCAHYFSSPLIRQAPPTETKPFYLEVSLKHEQTKEYCASLLQFMSQRGHLPFPIRTEQQHLSDTMISGVFSDEFSKANTTADTSTVADSHSSFGKQSVTNLAEKFIFQAANQVSLGELSNKPEVIKEKTNISTEAKQRELLSHVEGLIN